MADALEKAKASQIADVEALTGKRLDETLQQLASWAPAAAGASRWGERRGAARLPARDLRAPG